MMMKKNVFVLAFLLFGIYSTQLIAQDTEEVTEEEIMKFAVMEENFHAYLSVKQDSLVTMIKSDEAMAGGARYNEIKAVWGNEDKMAEIKITDEERKSYQKIQDFVDNLGKDASQFKKNMIMDDAVLGAATYNKIMKAMASDPSVKEKVDAMISELKEKRKSNGADVTQ